MPVALALSGQGADPERMRRAATFLEGNAGRTLRELR